MCKRLLFFAAALIQISFLSGEKPKAISSYETYCQQAIAMNELAGNIQSLDDARKLVDMIAEEFSDELPPRWVTRKMRDRIAQAEYESATNPAMLIPEQRVADAWNRFAREIGAPDETNVTAAEIHYLRDASYVGARIFWMRGNQSIWSMPNIYPVGQYGTVADGCRALDAIREVHDLAYQPDIISGAREMVRKGVLFSDEIEQESKTPHRSESFGVARMELLTNPIEAAGERYVKERGERALRHAVENLLDDLVPE
jgi:hypothetical protein